MHTVKSVPGKNAEGVFRRKKEWEKKFLTVPMNGCAGSEPVSGCPAFPSSEHACGIQCSQQYGAVPPKIWDVLGLGNS